MSQEAAVSPGWRLFARYAYAPNAKGYCGPPQAAPLESVARGGGADVDVEALARRFSGAWPYHVLIAELAGIEDPLDERVGRAYWTGSELTGSIDARRLGELLIDRFSRQAGHYWQHLDERLLQEITPTHVFHVLAVYPWSRLLKSGRPEPLEVLDSCRIRPGRIVSVGEEQLTVTAESLDWDGRALSLTEPQTETVSYWAEGMPQPPQPGDEVAVHWGHVCEIMQPADAERLRHYSRLQIELTNARLAADLDQAL